MLDAIKGDKDLKASALKFVENYNSDEDEKNYDIVHVKEKPKWDCETIISTYSNLYNRPKVWLECPRLEILWGSMGCNVTIPMFRWLMMDSVRDRKLVFQRVEW